MTDGSADLAGRRSWLSWLLAYDKYLMLAVFVVLSTAMTDKFLTSENITNLLRQNAAIGIATLAQLLVILTGGIDLSVGANASMCGIFAAVFLKSGYSWQVACLFTLGIGTLAGALNGIIITKARITPFIVTLASMTMYQGVALLVSKGRQVFFTSPDFLLLGSSNIWGIPLTAFVWLVFCVAIHIFLSRMMPGRFIRGIGGNKEAVRLAGISAVFYESLAYIIGGFLCAVAGILMTSRLTLGTNVVGQGWELVAIASVMVGGGSSVGGVGTVGGTVVGVFILALIGNFMNLMNISIYWQQIIRGMIILGAVYISSRKQR